MSTANITAHSVVEPSRRTKTVAATLVIAYALISMIPLVWYLFTAMSGTSPAGSRTGPTDTMAS